MNLQLDINCTLDLMCKEDLWSQYVEKRNAAIKALGHQFWKRENISSIRVIDQGVLFVATRKNGEKFRIGRGHKDYELCWALMALYQNKKAA